MNLGFRQSVTSIYAKIRDNLPTQSLKTTGLLVNKAVELEKTRRSLVTQQYIDQVDKMVDQPYPYVLLKKYFNKHPFLRIVGEARITEVIRNRWDVQECFAKKCTVCGQKFEQLVEECPDCKEQGFLRDPNPQEKKRLEAFLATPNRDDMMVDIIKSVMKDNLSVDDWYVSLKHLGGMEWTIYVEDSAEMFITADEHGRLGNGVWFCPKCWEAGKHEKTYPSKDACPECGELLKETAYVQKHLGTIRARFGRDEIIHGNNDPWLPQLYGNSKVVAILLELRSALAMSTFNFGAYSKGVMDKFIVLKGEGKQKADEIADSIKEQRHKVVIDDYTGRIGRETGGSVVIGVQEGIEVHDLMAVSEKMQSLDWYEFWFVKICGAIYGVQPVMMNAPTRGPGGYFQRMQMVVQNDKTREDQRMLEDLLFNGLLLEKMGVHDWQIKFNEIEPRNELETAQIWQTKVVAGAAAVEAGLTAELTDEHELKISGEFVKSEVPRGARSFITDLPSAPKPPEPQQNVPFAMDKIAKTHSRTKCMSCSKAPTVEVLWAEGMAHAWFCDKHFEEWKKKPTDMSNTRTYEGDIVSQRKINGVASKKWSHPKSSGLKKGKSFIVTELEQSNTGSASGKGSHKDS